jgi:DNA-binding NarL/FixJ family response regulator
MFSESTDIDVAEDDFFVPPIPFEMTPEQVAAMEEKDRRFIEAAERQMRHEQAGERRYGDMFKSGREYAEHAHRVTRWVVEGLLPEGHLAILGGTSKAGKTCFAHALAMSVATATPFLGMNVIPGAVLWCAFEEAESERLEILRQWPEHPWRFYITHEKPMIDTEEGLSALSYWVSRTDAKLIVIDPLFGATEAEGLNDGRVARRVLSGLKNICRTGRCAALVLHHITKDVSAGMVRERFAESGQLLATASMDMLMDATDLPKGGRMLNISCRGRGDFCNRTLTVRSDGVTHYELMSDLPPPAKIVEHREAAILRVLAQAPAEGMTSVEIAKGLAMNVQTIRNYLTRLSNDGKVCVLPRAGRAVAYARAEG